MTGPTAFRLSRSICWPKGMQQIGPLMRAGEAHLLEGIHLLAKGCLGSGLRLGLVVTQLCQLGPLVGGFRLQLLHPQQCLAQCPHQGLQQQQFVCTMLCCSDDKRRGSWNPGHAAGPAGATEMSEGESG